MSEPSGRKTAIVTGASRGIGRAIAVELARDGCYVIVNYRSNDKAAAETLAMVRAEGGDGEVMKFDVADSAETEKAVTDIAGRFPVIDILVNNAGITADNLFLMMPEADWDRVIATTLKGFYNMTKPVLKKMLRQKRGSVVSIASVAGIIGNKGQANYSAAKAGLIGASRSIASEIAKKGIRVNVVAPGLIETDMIRDAPVEMIKNIIPMGRIGKPDEVAKVVRFLCSDDASYITGQVISVNGGMM
ncbi:MAG TPA: 3-oxoacyl-ACP reductase FabG [Spirochaetota bacterium]|nr:3-oxoacyl-ACP reductase FabG [Spirochaetota bacterium]HPL15857.1 3-oxoacyl-ACP reductase FabG [Spirochaetota bacterium]HQF08499.1 3-oxoacyl-ACP reductase FabG [Spirochaetota bacterium]HQH97264.1 3-oxoacyl-ACP reductase FabG [Spirochaetota bacterium]HQJ70571.1 3-oxoacyl-ACP reductase FabG [Spirochaetota bacterium]